MGEIRTFDQALRRDFGPYLDRENATAFLSALLDRGVDRKVLYHLEICNILINNGKEIFKRTPQEVLPGIKEGGQKNVAASLIARADEGTVRPYQEGVGTERLSLDPFARWDRQEYDLEAWARRDGCWSDDILNRIKEQYGEEIAHGTEAHVFQDGPNHVVKVISAPFDVQETLDRISITNYLLGEPVTLSLLGMGRNSDDEFCFLVRQQFIKGKHVKQGTYTIDALDTFEELPLPGKEHNPDYVTGNYLIGDLHDRNVLLTPEGNLAIIDCNVFLNTPDLGRKGTWEIPDVEYDEKDIPEIHRILRGILPGSCDREVFLRRFDTPDGYIRKQLQASRRLEGTIILNTKNNGPTPYCVAVDPENRDNVIYNPVSKIQTLVKYDNRFTSEEKRVLAFGLTLKKGDTGYRFDLDKGRVIQLSQRKLKLKQEQSNTNKTVRSL